MRIKELCELASATSKEKGFQDPEQSIGEQIANIHAEVSEALNAYRERGLETWAVESAEVPGRSKPEGFGVELADAVIRICDTAGRLGIDLESLVRKKAVYNAFRPRRHGGKLL